MHTCFFFLFFVFKCYYIQASSHLKESVHSFERYELPRVLLSFYLYHLAVEGHASHSMYLSVTICFQLSRKAEPSSMCLTHLSWAREAADAGRVREVLDPSLLACCS